MKIIDAYRAGQHGDELSDEDKARKRGGRIIRAAHRLGKKSGEALDAQDAAFEREQARVLDAAVEQAQGPNKTALQIIKTLGRIPHQKPSRPAGYTRSIDGETREPLSNDWLAIVEDSTHASKDPSRSGGTVLSGSPLGHLKITDMELDKNDGFNKFAMSLGGLTEPPSEMSIPVDSLTIATSAPLHQESMLRPKTTLYLNSRPYHVDERDYNRPHAETVTLQIGPDGQVKELVVSAPNVSGLVHIDTTKATVEAGVLLESVLMAAEQTATMYEELQQGITSRDQN